MKEELKDALANNSLSPFVKSLSNDGIKYFELLTQENSSKMRSGFVTLKSGDKIGEHSTGNYEEMLIVISGEGELMTDKTERLKIKQGDIAYNPPDTKHDVINTGTNDLKYIFVVTPA